MANDRKKILVTGATGFIGLEVAKLLSERGLALRFLVRRPQRAPLLGTFNAEIVQGDLTSPESLSQACKGIDAIIHLGARAIFEEYDRVKPTIVDGSIHLIRAAVAAGVKQFVYGSSLLVYNSQPEPLTAHTPENPQCGYGIAKLEAEEQLAQIASEEGVSLAILRLPHVYGPNDLLFNQIRTGSVFYPGDGSNQFSHLHIEDCARLLAAVVEEKWTGVSPVADDLAVSWNAFFEQVKTYYPRLRIYKVPYHFSLLLTHLYTPFRRLQRRPSVYTPGSVTSWNSNLVVEKGLVWKDLGIQPHYPTIFTGIPAVLNDAIPFQWIPSVLDSR